MSTIPCYIVEEHQEIVEPLFRLIKARKLCYEGLFMLNLDSHSDLSVPNELAVGEDSFLDKHEVLNKIDIQSWIIPLYYMEIVKSLCWLHPDWTKHSFESESNFKVGKLINGSQLKVTSASNYFISEGDYEHEHNLNNLHNASLFVHALSSQHTDTTYISELGQKFRNIITQHSDFILSIDLDFFSTHDPFLSSFSHKQYSLLKKIYAFAAPEGDFMADISICVERRRNQLQNLKEFFSTVHNNPENINYKDVSDDVKELVESLLERDGGDYDWEWLHEMGRGLDDCPPPHHPSSPYHITTLINNVKSFLTPLPTPKAIFVSRSSEDDFCPKSQVEQIQELLLTSLHQLYPNIDIIKLYEIKK